MLFGSMIHTYFFHTGDFFMISFLLFSLGVGGSMTLQHASQLEYNFINVLQGVKKTFSFGKTNWKSFAINYNFRKKIFFSLLYFSLFFFFQSWKATKESRHRVIYDF